MVDTIEHGTIASVHYTGTFAEGESSIAAEERIPGFLSWLRADDYWIREKMLGAKVGEKREFTLSPEDAYGERIEDAIQKVERKTFLRIWSLKSEWSLVPTVIRARFNSLLSR